MEWVFSVEQLGKENLKPITYPSSDAISTICYTSVCGITNVRNRGATC
jgi:hypothetical protein